MNQKSYLGALVVGIVCFAISGCRSGQDAAAIPTVKTDRWLKIHAGESCAFRLNLATGEFARILVEQRDIDLSVAASFPDGSDLPKWSGSEYGYEAIDVLASREGSYWIKVVAPLDDSAEGQFRIWVAEIRRARATDNLNLKAHRLVATALADKSSSAESTARKITAAAQAAAWWRDSGDLLREAQALNLFGRFSQRTGQFTTAQKAYSDALRIFDQLKNEYGRLETLKMLVNLGGYFGESANLPVLQKYLAGWRALKDRRGQAVMISSIATSYHLAKDFDQEIAYEAWAARLWRDLGNQTKISESFKDLSSMYMALRRPREAVEASEQALTMDKRNNDSRGVAASLADLGMALEIAGRYKDAQRNLRESLSYREAEGDKTAVMATSLALCKIERNHEDWNSAFADCKHGLQLEDGVAREFVDPVQKAWFFQFFVAYQIYVSALMSRWREHPRPEYQTQAFLLADQMRTLYPEPQLGPPNLTDLMKLLDDHTMLLEYWTHAPDSIGVAWLLTRSGLTSVTLSRPNLIPKLAEQAFRGLSEREASPNTRATMSNALYELSRVLLGPIQRQIANKRLLIVNDESFAFLPLGILPDPSRADGAPLLASHQIVYLPSASMLFALRNRPSESVTHRKLLAILSDPVFDPGDVRFQSGARRAVTGRPLASLAVATRSFGWYRSGRENIPRLAFAGEEARAVASTVPTGRATIYAGFDANRQIAMKNLANYRIIHFITHGLVNRAEPQLSGLILSLFDEHGRRRPGFLSLPDVYGLTLNADLVTLSACQTALGLPLDAQGIIGLTSAFFHAGAHRVVSSSWRVDDEATAQLMAAFYENLLRKRLEPGEALRQAQLSVAGDVRWRAPYYWAGFRLYGDSRLLWRGRT